MTPDQPLMPGGESAEAQLALARASCNDLKSKLWRAREHVVELEESEERALDKAQSATRERDLARADLASARTELDATRTARDNVCRDLADAKTRIAELEYRPGPLVSAYDALACLTPDGCGRFVADDGTPLAHHCGLGLTPVRVTLTHREGATPA